MYLYSICVGYPDRFDALDGGMVRRFRFLSMNLCRVHCWERRQWLVMIAAADAFLVSFGLCT